MSNENPTAAEESSSDRPKSGKKVGRAFPKILMDGQFVMIFGAKRPPTVSGVLESTPDAKEIPSDHGESTNDSIRGLGPSSSD